MINKPFFKDETLFRVQPIPKKSAWQAVFLKFPISSIGKEKFVTVKKTWKNPKKLINKPFFNKNSF